MYEAFNRVESYNGYCNKPTWVAMQLIDNDEGFQTYWYGRALALWDETEAGEILSRYQETVKKLENELEDWIDWMAEYHTTDLFMNSLLLWAAAYINKKEMAEHMVDSCEDVCGR